MLALVEAPYAEYALIHRPAGITVTMPHGIVRLPLVPNFTFSVANERGWPVQVEGSQLLELGWGGKRNHTIDYQPNRGWRLNHIGHPQMILHNTRALDATTGSVPLADGDRIVPARGVIFAFRMRPEVPALAEKVLSSALRNLLLTATSHLPAPSGRYDVGYEWYDALIASQKTQAGQVLTDWVLEHVADPDTAKHVTLQLLSRHGMRADKKR